MYIKILLNYILGYVDVVVEGFFVERFINMCINKNILLWKIKRDKSTIVYTRVGIRDFKEVAKVAKLTKCKIKIKNKKGMPFIFNKYKKRKIFILCVIIIFLCILILSNFIWNIEITGTENLGKDELISILQSQGLTIGKLKSKINTREIINKIRLDRKDIAWVGIELQGTNAIVKIVEADKKPDIIDEEEYCNIIAEKDAQIIKINAQNGTPNVKEGDIVKKGTVLIAGWLEGKYTGTRYVHSEGTVEAKVWYSEKERIYFKQNEEEKTGKIEKKYEININNFKINLYKKLPKFEKYDTIIENKKIKLFSNLYLPIELIKINYFEKNDKEVTYSLEEAKEIGINKCEDTLKNKTNLNNLLNKYINIDSKDEYIDVEVIYEIKESIGTKEKIVF